MKSLILYFLSGFTAGFLFIFFTGSSFLGVFLVAALSIAFEVFLYIRSVPPKREEASDFVCIVIPAYNEEGSLKRSVESALNQSYEKRVVVLVNDNSTDSTGALMKKYAEENEGVIYLENKKNLGKFGSIMRAYREVEADVYVIVDADNEFPENYVEYYVSRMKGIDALESSLSSYNSCNSFTSIIHTLEISLMSSIRVMNLFPNFTGRGMFIRREVFEFLDKEKISGKDDGAMMNVAMKFGRFRYRYFTGPILKEYATEKFRDFVNQRDRWYILGMLETIKKSSWEIPMIFGLYSGLVFSTLSLGIVLPALGFLRYGVLSLELIAGTFIHSSIYSKKLEVGCNLLVGGVLGVVMIVVNVSLILRSFLRIVLGKVPSSWYKVSKS